MITALPWQLNVLVAEALISMVAGFILTEYVDESGKFKRTPQWAITWACSDATCVGLMLWAGNSSWQHFLYVAMYLWAIVMGLIKGFRREEMDLTKTPEGRDMKTGVQVFTGAMALFIITLIVTG